jgi:hypothetical protein
MPEQSKCRLVIVERLRVQWCRLMHDAPMWPIHGVYRCRTCGQSYPVPWAGEHLLLPSRLVIQQAERAVESGA